MAPVVPSVAGREGEDPELLAVVARDTVVRYAALGSPTHDQAVLAGPPGYTWQYQPAPLPRAHASTAKLRMPPGSDSRVEPV